MFRTKGSFVFSIILLGFALLILIGASIPFLPGPAHLNIFSNRLYDLISGLTILPLLAMPIGFVWIVFTFIGKTKSRLLPIILLVVPILAIKSFNIIADNFRDHARDRSIQEASVLIDAIEFYHDSNGEYPDSVPQLVPHILGTIPRPSSMGSLDYAYKRVGETYEVEFYQNVIMNFNIEVVMYNPLGNHKGRGAIPFLKESGHENWKYFIID